MIRASTLLSPDTRGDMPLRTVFWAYGVAASHLLFATLWLLYPHVHTRVYGAMTAAFVVYTVWIMRLIWINAFNVANEALGHVARALTVAWALNALLVSGFLFLGHAAGEPLPF